MKKTSALMLVDALGMTNGVSTMARDLFNNWPAVADRCHLSILGSGPVQHYERLPGASFHIATSMVACPGYPDLTLGPVVPQLVRLLRMRSFAVIHAATPGPLGIAGAIAARVLGLPLVVTHHTRFTEYVPLYVNRRAANVVASVVRTLLKCYFGAAVLTLAHSPEAEQEARRLGARKTRCIPMGVNVPFRSLADLRRRKKTARREAIRLYGLDSQLPLLLYVGRLAPEKRVLLLASALSNASVNLIMAGLGPLRDALLRYPNLVIAGNVVGADLSRLYLAADLLVSASTTETFGRVFLEALAHGTPILVPRRGLHLSALPADKECVNTFDATPHSLQRATERALTSTGADCIEHAIAAASQRSWDRVIPAHAAIYIETARG